jgi:hypothetical protein
VPLCKNGENYRVHFQKEEDLKLPFREGEKLNVPIDKVEKPKVILFKVETRSPPFTKGDLGGFLSLAFFL